MSGNASTGGDLDSASDTGIYYRQIPPASDDADYNILTLVADLEGVAVESLPSFYDEVDHLVENLFRCPPSADAQMEIEFTYFGYRITVDQTGQVKLRKEICSS
ncbi:MAG: HalOD1 output domain-containing protein [Haloarculaceae archaeon]